VTRIADRLIEQGLHEMSLNVANKLERSIGLVDKARERITRLLDEVTTIEVVDILYDALISLEEANEHIYKAADAERERGGNTPIVM